MSYNNLGQSYGNFKLIAFEKVNGIINVSKFRSNKTGLTVVVAQVEGPVVNGYFALATEALDDDGLPHTLEHMIFLGSEDYPYKGVLDLLANRMLAPGSNAWTDIDHTCYTVTTAGSEGFLSLMPIYIDHILYPVLNDSAFITEVHHINGEGKDAGVVYCEEEGMENSGEHRVFLELLRKLYPGECGYKSNVGGSLKNLRESTDNIKIHNFHRQFYRPENLTLIITGQIDEKNLFDSLEPVENKIISKGTLAPFQRPWQNPIPPFSKSVDSLILYPNDLEDNGIVNIGWRGPSAVHLYYEMSACSTLLRYLTDTSISWLQKEFVEIDDPFASTVTFSLQENSIPVFYMIFENVPLNKLELIRPKLEKSLLNFYESDDSLSLPRLKSLIEKQKAETLTSLENQPHDSIAFMIIGDMLHGNTTEDLKRRLNAKDLLNRMLIEPKDFWKRLLKKYFIDSPKVTVMGKASKKEQEELTRMENERIAKQIEALGPEGLGVKHKILTEAIKINEIQPPVEVLTKLPIPDTNKISFHSIKSYTSDFKDNEKINFSKAPVYMYIDDLKTNFVYMLVIMNTKSLSLELRPYLPLFLELILESPVQRDDSIIKHEQVVEELEAETISVSTKIGIEAMSRRFSCGSYCHSANLALQVEPSKYQEGIKWLRELLYSTVFTKERLQIVATKIINDVPQWKRKGSKIVYDLMKAMRYNEGSNHYWNSLLRQQKFLTDIVEKLKSPAEAEVIFRELDAVRMLLTAPGNMAVYMAANLDNLATLYPDIIEPWSKLLPKSIEPVKMKYSVVSDYLYTNNNENSNIQNCIVGLGCIDSAFLCQTVKGITDYNDPDLPALLVFIQYLTQVEGPLWRQIRGQGLSYSYNISFKPNEGLLYLTFYRSTHIFATYNETKKILESYFDESCKLEGTLIDSAKSSLIFEIIEAEKNIGDVVLESILSYFKNVDHNYNKNLVAKVFKVTSDEMLKVGKKYVSPLFDTKNEESKMSIVCHPSKISGIVEKFQQLNVKLTVYKNLEETFLSN
ncbi:conserved hypothetical protein [Pediculus humanus corporis]|uniref:Presequence protease, mitochondrial n=1 Tax=Pediculus humanus subsp. corporis TaxID=121224 RepID=E0VBV7_PEDHC|nr:uncharacterized protein Phum_PHUM073940 [Pediculus humanus corporis]EEB10863.1 conserved hypothetical protein [Pediculus humanus corporis]